MTKKNLCQLFSQQVSCLPNPLPVFGKNSEFLIVPVQKLIMVAPDQEYFHSNCYLAKSSSFFGLADELFLELEPQNRIIQLERDLVVAQITGRTEPLLDKFVSAFTEKGLSFLAQNKVTSDVSLTPGHYPISASQTIALQMFSDCKILPKGQREEMRERIVNWVESLC